MSLQFPIPQFVGQAVRYQGTSWVWDGTGWHVDDVASRLDLALIPAYLGQFVHVVADELPLPSSISLGVPDIYGATFTLSPIPPLEGVKVYVNGTLQVLDDGSGNIGDYVINRAANSIDFLLPLDRFDTVTIGVLMPPDSLAPGRVDVQPIKDLDTDWVTDPQNPTTGLVDGVRRTFDLLIDVAGVGQQFAVISRPTDLAVFVAGLRQRADVDYTAIGAELTMTVAPAAGVPFWALWYQPAGASAGGAVAPPQPPLDTRLSYYGSRPGAGIGWQDARGLTITVPTAGARTALRPDIDVLTGSLVLQADTATLWRWTGAAWSRYLDGGLFTDRLGGAAQVLRSTTALQRPAAASLLPGQLWINMTDAVFGFGDQGGDPVVLLPRVPASAGNVDAGKLPELNAKGQLDQSFFIEGMRPYGTVNPGSILVLDWNDAHLAGTAPVRAAAGALNRPPGADLAYAGQYISMGDANTGVLTAMSPQGNTVYVRPRSAGAWGAWIQVNSPGLDISSAMLRANNLSDVANKAAGRANLGALLSQSTVFAGDLNALAESGLYPLGIGVTNGWANDGTGSGGEATVGDAVLHMATGGSLAYQLGFNLRPAAPAARPLRLRFMTGPSTWTPWVSILTADEVTAAIAAATTLFGLGTNTLDKDANALGLTTEMFFATANGPATGNSWHTWMHARATDARAGQVAVENSASGNRPRLAWRHRGGAGGWAAWAEAQPILSGTTAQRPTTGLVAGLMYFDTTLGRPVYRNAANTAWADVLDQVPPGTSVGAAAPANPVPGQLWYRTVAPVGLFVWFNDGDSSQWVQAAGGGASLSGEQIINTAGLTSVVFDQIPLAATAFTLTFGNVTFSDPNTNLRLDFSGAPAQAHTISRQVLGAAYAAPVPLAGAEINIDEFGGAVAGIQGIYFFERVNNSGSVWLMTGQHRRTASILVSNTGRLIINETALTPPRLRTSVGTFATSSIACRWRI
jgi:hypothetical protein